MNKSILLCGVGGQGTVLASKIIAAAAMNDGNTVHSAETIGMAQRGGSVTSHVRIGTAFSPLIPLHGADMILAFEPAEAARNLAYLKKDGLVIVNRVPVMPITEALNASGYDGSEMIGYLKKNTGCIVFDGGCLPSAKFLNIAMLGVAAGSGRLGIETDLIRQEIERRVPPKFLEANIKAFETGIWTGGEN